MNCPRCGNENSDNTIFCNHCDKILINSPEEIKGKNIKTGKYVGHVSKLFPYSALGLGLGIGGIVFPVLSIFAIIFSAIGLKQNKNKTMGKAGLWMGIGIFSCWFLIVIFFLFYIAIS